MAFAALFCGGGVMVRKGFGGGGGGDEGEDATACLCVCTWGRFISCTGFDRKLCTWRRRWRADFTAEHVSFSHTRQVLKYMYILFFCSSEFVEQTT